MPDSPEAPTRPEGALRSPTVLDRFESIAPPLVALAVFVLVGGAVAMLRAGSSIFSPIILSLFLVTLALPPYRWLKRRGVKQGFALLIMMASMVIIGLLLAALVWLSAQRLLVGLSAYSEGLDAGARTLVAALGLDEPGEIALALSGLLKTLMLGMATATASVVAQFSFSVLLAAFLLMEAPRFGRLLHTSMKNLPFLGMTPQVMEAAIQYFFVRLKLNALTGIGFGLFLWLMGVDHAALWGVLAAALSFVPYVGLVVASIPPVLLALAESGVVWALLVIVGVTAINFVIENALAPSMTGRSLSLSPAVVFVSFAVWIWVLGAVGALVAMPVTVLLMLTFRQYEATRWVAQIIGRVDA